MNDDQFHVVVTKEWTIAVPSTWVFPIDMTVCYPEDEIITTAISKKRKPQDSWNKSSYQFLIGPFDTYIEARNVEKESVCISSDDDTDALRSKIPLGGNKRRKNSNKKSDFLYTSDFGSEKDKNLTPKGTTLTVECEGKSDEESNHSDNSSDNGDATRQLQVQSSSLKSLPKCPINKDIDLSTNVQTIELEGPSSSKASKLDVANPSHNISKDISTSHSTFCCAACRQENALQWKKVLRQLHGIASLLQDQVPTNAKDAAGKKIEHVSELPLQTLVQFTDFENKLKGDIELQHSFETMVLRLGGESAIKHLKNVLQYTFSIDLRKSLCWSGQKGRVGVKTSLTSKIIMETVLGKFPNSTWRELEVLFQEWLRRGGDCIRSKISSRL